MVKHKKLLELNEAGGNSSIAEQKRAEDDADSDLDDAAAGGGSESGEDAANQGTAPDLSIESLRKVFHLPCVDAAVALGVAHSKLKRRCHKLKISRWPQRKLASLMFLREALPNDRRLTEVQRECIASKIDDEYSRVMGDPNHPLDKELEQLRKSNYKLNYNRKLKVAAHGRHGDEGSGGRGGGRGRSGRGGRGGRGGGRGNNSEPRDGSGSPDSWRPSGNDWDNTQDNATAAGEVAPLTQMPPLPDLLSPPPHMAATAAPAAAPAAAAAAMGGRFQGPLPQPQPRPDGPSAIRVRELAASFGADAGVKSEPNSGLLGRAALGSAPPAPAACGWEPQSQEEGQGGAGAAAGPELALGGPSLVCPSASMAQRRFPNPITSGRRLPVERTALLSSINDRKASKAARRESGTGSGAATPHGVAVTLAAAATAFVNGGAHAPRMAQSGGYGPGLSLPGGAPPQGGMHWVSAPPTGVEQRLPQEEWAAAAPGSAIADGGRGGSRNSPWPSGSFGLNLAGLQLQPSRHLQGSRPDYMDTQDGRGGGGVGGAGGGHGAQGMGRGTPGEPNCGLAAAGVNAILEDTSAVDMMADMEMADAGGGGGGRLSMSGAEQLTAEELALLGITGPDRDLLLLDQTDTGIDPLLDSLLLSDSLLADSDPAPGNMPPSAAGGAPQAHLHPHPHTQQHPHAPGNLDQYGGGGGGRSGWDEPFDLRGHAPPSLANGVSGGGNFGRGAFDSMRPVGVSGLLRGDPGLGGANAALLSGVSAGGSVSAPTRQQHMSFRGGPLGGGDPRFGGFTADGPPAPVPQPQPHSYSTGFLDGGGGGQIYTDPGDAAAGRRQDTQPPGAAGGRGMAWEGGEGARRDKTSRRWRLLSSAGTLEPVPESILAGLDPDSSAAGGPSRRNSMRRAAAAGAAAVGRGGHAPSSSETARLGSGAEELGGDRPFGAQPLPYMQTGRSGQGPQPQRSLPHQHSAPGCVGEGMQAQGGEYGQAHAQSHGQVWRRGHPLLDGRARAVSLQTASANLLHPHSAEAGHMLGGLHGGGGGPASVPVGYSGPGSMDAHGGANLDALGSTISADWARMPGGGSAGRGKGGGGGRPPEAGLHGSGGSGSLLHGFSREEQQLARQQLAMAMQRCGSGGGGGGGGGGALALNEVLDRGPLRGGAGAGLGPGRGLPSPSTEAISSLQGLRLRQEDHATASAGGDGGYMYQEQTRSGPVYADASPHQHAHGVGPGPGSARSHVFSQGQDQGQRSRGAGGYLAAAPSPRGLPQPSLQLQPQQPLQPHPHHQQQPQLHGYEQYPQHRQQQQHAGSNPHALRMQQSEGQGQGQGRMEHDPMQGAFQHGQQDYGRAPHLDPHVPQPHQQQRPSADPYGLQPRGQPPLHLHQQQPYPMMQDAHRAAAAPQPRAPPLDLRGRSGRMSALPAGASAVAPMKLPLRAAAGGNGGGVAGRVGRRVGPMELMDGGAFREPDGFGGGGAGGGGLDLLQRNPGGGGNGYAQFGAAGPAIGGGMGRHGGGGEVGGAARASPRAGLQQGSAQQLEEMLRQLSGGTF